MKSSSLPTARQILDGTARVFLAESLVVPTRLLTVTFLTHQLGPESFGLFTLAAAIVGWVESSINTLFSRPALKLVSESDDLKSVGATIVRLYLAVSLVATLVLCFVSALVARLFDEPRLAMYLQLFALDIPLSGLTQAHYNLLVGAGDFRPRALSSASRWIARLLFVAILVELGLSINGAILGSLGASLTALVIARLYVRPRLWTVSIVKVRGLWDYVGPLALFSMAVTLLSTLDLLMLKALGATASQTGIYGAAQSLTILPGLFALSFSPLLLSTLGRLTWAGEVAHAKDMSSDAMRLVIVLLPFAGMTAGMAHEIVGLIFGPLFAAAAPILAMLIFGALGMTMISVTTAVLIAAGKPTWTLLQVGPLLPVAIAGYLLMIPRFGPLGASAVATFCSGLGAIASVAAVYRVWRVAPPVLTFVRALVVCALAFLLAMHWSTTGGFLVVKIGAITAVIGGSFLALGEFNASELALARSLFGWKGSI